MAPNEDCSTTRRQPETPPSSRDSLMMLSNHRTTLVTPSCNPYQAMIPTQDQYESAIRGGVSFPQQAYGVFCDTSEPRGYGSTMNETSVPQQRPEAVLPKTTRLQPKDQQEQESSVLFWIFNRGRQMYVPTNQSPIENEKESTSQSAAIQGPLNTIGVTQSSNQESEPQNSQTRTT